MTKGVGFDQFWDDGGGKSNMIPRQLKEDNLTYSDCNSRFT